MGTFLCEELSVAPESTPAHENSQTTFVMSINIT